MFVDVDSAYTFGAAIRQRRSELGLSQATVAAQANISRQLLIRIEQGHPRVELSKALTLAKALNVHIVFDDQPRQSLPTNLEAILGRSLP